MYLSIKGKSCSVIDRAPSRVPRVRARISNHMPSAKGPKRRPLSAKKKQLLYRITATTTTTRDLSSAPQQNHHGPASHNVLWAHEMPPQKALKDKVISGCDGQGKHFSAYGRASVES